MLQGHLTDYSTDNASVSKMLLSVLLLLGYFYSAKITQCSKCALSTVTHQIKMSSVYFWACPMICLVCTIQQEDGSTPEITGQQSCSLCSSFWYSDWWVSSV